MRLFLFLSVLCFSLPALAAPICGDFPAPLKGGYCITLAEGSNKDIVYHLHGLNLSQHAWSDDSYYTEQIREYWKEHNMAAPTVVAISFGPMWVLAPRNSSEVSGLLDIVSEKIIPELETKLGGLKGRRILLGESMGGFNSLQLAMRTSLFAKAAVLCAPVYDGITTFSAPFEVEAYVKKSKAFQYYKNNSVLERVTFALRAAGMFFPTPTDIEAADPMLLARKTSSVKFYLAAGQYDAFAAYEGNVSLAKILSTNGTEIEWRPQWGGHCAIDIPSVSEFLLK